VINQQGRLAKLYLTQARLTPPSGSSGSSSPTRFSSLLPSHPAVHSHLSYAQIDGNQPGHRDQPSRRRAAGYVNLGPGQPGQGSPHLYLFLRDPGDQEITNPRRPRLERAFNAYQSAGGPRAGLPRA